MSIREPRCMVCGACLDQGAIFNKDPRISETCSYECAEIYFTNPDDNNKETTND